jgi:aspartate ammonia-lyase
MTLGQAFGGYAAVVRRHADQLDLLMPGLLAAPLGGTAIGTGLGARPGYRSAILDQLAEVTGLPVKPPGDIFDAMQNADDFARLSGELRSTANSLWKIANDIILLSSGPAGGLGELQLPEVQAGSSIMPGKVNPVLPMSICQIALAINGNDVTVALAAQQGVLELNHYELLIADRLLDSLRMLAGATDVFCVKCIDRLSPDEERSWDNLIRSSATATSLVPKLGYARVSQLVRQGQAQGRSFLDHARAEGVLSDADLRKWMLEAAAKDDA